MKKNLRRKVFIIAEAGVNHNGCIRTAKKLIDVAAKSGADAVKFQAFIAEEVAIRNAPKAKYQQKTTNKNKSHSEILKQLQLNIDQHKQLMQYCKQRKITFLSSCFDLKSADSLYELGLSIFKIPSGEITNLPLLKKIGSFKKEIILSSGMSNLKEIKDAIGILIKAGTLKKMITVLHCNTEYPTPTEDVNLLAMLTIRDRLNVKVGYSDHTLGIEVPIAATALGATVIEKHFTLDRKMKGSDHKASLEPNELKSMIKAIRKIEKALGDGIKKPSNSELKNRPVARKSIVAAHTILKDQIFNEHNITAKRPEFGISPMRWNEVIGKTAKRDFNKDSLIEL